MYPYYVILFALLYHKYDVMLRETLTLLEQSTERLKLSHLTTHLRICISLVTAIKVALKF